MSRAWIELYRLLDEAAASHVPVLITGRRANAVLIAEEDWRAIQETLYLLSIPGMRESIRKGMGTPVAACAKKLRWWIWDPVYTRQAQKDAKKLAAAGLNAAVV